MTQSIKINKSVPITNIVTDIENLLSELTNYISIQLADENYPALTISGTPDTSQVDADLLDGQEGSYYTDADNIIYDNTTSGLSAVNVQAAIDEVDSIKVDEFIVPRNGGTVVWHKVGELTTNIGPKANNLTLLVSGVSDYGNNKPGVDVVQVSTHGGVSVDVYSLIPPGVRSQTYGYVNNTSTGKTEIWVKRDTYTYDTHFAVLNVDDATYGNLASSSTEPSGIVYVDIKTHWTSGNDGSGSGLDADLLDGLHASSFVRSDTGEINISGIPFYASFGNRIIKSIGSINELKAGVILFAKVYSGTTLPKQGFVGKLFVDRGSAAAINMSYEYDVVCTTAYDRSFLTLTGNHTNCYLAKVNYNGEDYYGVYSQVTGNRKIILDGFFYDYDLDGNGNPYIFIPDASGYTVTKVDSTQIYNNQNKIWHEGNDGSGSGLDADLLDGYHASDFALYGHSHNVLSSKGTQTPPTERTALDSGLYTYRYYVNGGPTPYGEVISFGANTTGRGEIAVSWLGTPQMYVRSLRDTIDSWTSWYKIWHEGNDGSGSGLDADTVDGYHASSFLQASSYTADDVLTKIKTVDGSGSGLDADTVDGYHASAFALAGHIHTDSSTIKPALNASGNAPIYACRAWVNFNGTTNPITIRAGGNVSSITDLRAAYYVVNFATPMPDSNYSVAGLCSILSGNDTRFVTILGVSTSSVKIHLYHDDGATGTRDASVVCVSIFR